MSTHERHALLSVFLVITPFEDAMSIVMGIRSNHVPLEIRTREVPVDVPIHIFVRIFEKDFPVKRGYGLLAVLG